MGASVKSVLPSRPWLWAISPEATREDMPARAVVAFEPDDPGAGKILLEAQNVVDVRAAPAVDRLVVVADAADVSRRAREQSEPQVLDGVGVLVLVDQNVAEAPLEAGEHVRVLPEEPQRLQEQVAEIDGVKRLQPRLVGGVQRGAAAAGEGARLARRDMGGIEAAILPAVDQAGERPGRPTLVVEVLR